MGTNDVTDSFSRLSAEKHRLTKPCTKLTIAFTGNLAASGGGTSEQSFRGNTDNHCQKDLSA
jgi:hypothetical protein